MSCSGAGETCFGKTQQASGAPVMGRDFTNEAIRAGDLVIACDASSELKGGVMLANGHISFSNEEAEVAPSQAVRVARDSPLGQSLLNKHPYLEQRATHAVQWGAATPEQYEQRLNHWRAGMAQIELAYVRVFPDDADAYVDEIQGEAETTIIDAGLEWNEEGGGGLLTNADKTTLHAVKEAADKAGLIVECTELVSKPGITRLRVFPHPSYEDSD